MGRTYVVEEVSPRSPGRDQVDVVVILKHVLWEEVGGWVGWVEGNEAVLMSCCMFSMGGWVGKVK